MHKRYGFFFFPKDLLVHVSKIANKCLGASTQCGRGSSVHLVQPETDGGCKCTSLLADSVILLNFISDAPNHTQIKFFVED